MIRHRISLLVLCLLLTAFAIPAAEGQRKRDSAKENATQQKETPKQGKRQGEDPQRRAKALRAVCERLNVDTGSVIADIGAGNGRDTWTFASIVGESGKVFSEEIEEGKCKSIKKAAEDRELPQVHTVLGTATSPELPADSVDMAFMHQVYHHVSKPREMLGAIWKSLKPGGYLVIVDQRRGTLVDWVPREERAKKHFWIGETTVVREARETGYSFVDFADASWHVDAAFVLIFQRPTTLTTPDRDPDAPAAIPETAVEQLLPAEGKSYQRVALIALGEGRKLISPLRKAAPCEAIDVVLEEWATQKTERPAMPTDMTLHSTLTEKGDPKLGPEPLDAVYFLDTYHLLFHGPTLLRELRARLTPDGRLYVLDRAADSEMTHREASHRRMIPPQLVKEELQQAGFTLVRQVPAIGEDRFLMVFAKSSD